MKKKYIVYDSVNSILEKEYIFKRFAKNGLKAVIVGYESFDDKQLKKWNKAATVDENYKATQILKKNGIAVWGSLILHPDFTKEDFKKLIKYNKKLSPELLTFFTSCSSSINTFILDDYEKWNFGEVVVYPSNMSLARFYFEMIKLTIPFNFNKTTIKYLFREYSVKNIFKMLFGFKGGAKIYIKNVLKKR